MVTVPRTVNTDVRLEPISGEKLRPVQTQQVGEAIGKGLQQLGQQGQEYAFEQQRVDESLDEAAAKQAFTAYSKFKTSRLYTDDDAFFNQNGQNALNARAPVETQLNEKITELGEGLTTPRQKAMFAHFAGRERERDGIAIANFSGRQADVYHDQQDGALQYQAGQEAAAAYVRGDERSFEVAKGTMLNSIRGQAARKGLAGEPGQVAEQKAVTALYANVAEQLAATDPMRAQAFVEKHRDQIKDIDTLTRLDKMIREPLEQQQADIDAGDARGRPAGTLPASFERLTQITIGSESGGDPNAISPKGAKGLMQVMDRTNGDPGYGVRAARDASPEERARVGRDYLKAMLNRYGGDPAKMWAAYNAGPDRLDKAIAERGADWRSAMPAETRRYVAKNTALLGSTVPTNAAQDSNLEAQLAFIDTRAASEGWSFGRREKARTRAMQLDAIDERLKADDEKKAADLAWTVALDPTKTTVRDINPSVWARVKPETQRSIMAALKANAKGEDPAPNPTLYLDLSAKAAAGTLKFSDVRDAWGKMPKGDWEQMATLARGIEKGDVDAKGKSATVSRVDNITVRALDSLPGLTYAGVKPKNRPEVAARRYAFQKVMLADIAVWQAQNKGKTIDDKTIQDIADRRLLQGNVGEDEPVYAFERAGERVTVNIPNKDIERIQARAVARIGRRLTLPEVSQAYLSEARGGL